MGMTSYERVYRALMETTTCKAVWAEAVKAVDSVALEKVMWTLRQNTDTATVVPVFQFTAGFSWREYDLSIDQVQAPLFLTADMARKVIDAHFGSGKDVKTFNCKGEIVRNGGFVNRKTRWGREKEHQDEFYQFLLDAFQDEVEEKLIAATKRLRDEIQEMRKTEAYYKSREEALIGFCKNTITQALLPWHTMKQSVLQDAWDQFICTAIMDT